MSERRKGELEHPAPEGLRVTAMDEIGPALVVLSFPLPDADDAFDDLTSAERDVACRAIQGSSNAEIASARGTHVRTVANQMASIFTKLGVSSRQELAARFAYAVSLE